MFHQNPIRPPHDPGSDDGCWQFFGLNYKFLQSWKASLPVCAMIGRRRLWACPPAECGDNRERLRRVRGGHIVTGDSGTRSRSAQRVKEGSERCLDGLTAFSTFSKVKADFPLIIIYFSQLNQLTAREPPLGASRCVFVRSRLRL